MKASFSNFSIAGLAIALLFSVRQCRTAEAYADTNMQALTDTLQHYTNALGTQTAAIKTLSLGKKQFKEVILKKDKQLAVLTKGFANVHNVTQYKTLTRYDTITVTYHDTVPSVFSRIGVVEKPWYRFHYKADQKGITLDSLTFPNTATVITGTKRKWFLGKETLFTEVTNTNPYITVTELKAAEITLPVPIYKKWYVWLSVGLAGGYLLGK